MRALENAVRGLRDELNAARTMPAGAAAAAQFAAAEPALAPDTPVQPGPVVGPVTAQPGPVADSDTSGEPSSSPAAPLTYEQLWNRVPEHAIRRPKSSLEALLAGRGLLFVGLLAVMIGVAYFLNYAFTHGWVGPLERILLGLAIGSGLIVYAARRIGSDLTFLAESLIGLGAGIDYLSLWASVAMFPDLHVPRALAFAAMIAVTAVLALLATRRRSERLAILGLIGGFITPLLLSAPLDRPLLAGYLLVLSGTMLALSVRASFRSVEALTFAGAVCYAPVFAIDAAEHWNDVACAAVATLFFAMFAVAFTLAAFYDRKASPGRLTLLALDTGGYALVLELALSARQTALGVTLLVVAAALFAAMRIPGLPRPMRTAYLYLGLALATLAPPALFHATSLIDVFTVEAALLVLVGTRGGDRVVLVAGMILFELIGVVLLLDAAGDPPQHALLGSLALAFAVYVAALGFAIARLRDAANLAQGLRNGWRTAGIVTVHVVAVAGLSRECVDVLGGPRGLDDIGSRAQFGLSAIWTLYATALFAIGMARREPLVRWLGLALFGCTIFKVFTVDLASLEVPYRILSFIGLGVVLVGVSAWYQRTMARQRAAVAELLD